MNNSNLNQGLDPKVKYAVSAVLIAALLYDRKFE